jgi:uncharacterized protein YbjT (DUF2867 family)
LSGKILIVGGTGRLGQPVVHRLANDGYEVRLMTHSPEKAGRIFGDKIETVFGDVSDPDSLAEPVRGCDAVYINLGAKMNLDDFERVEHLGTVNVAKAAAENAVNHIAMISGLNVGTADPEIPMYRAKIGAEKALIDSGIAYTIFRCCWFFESLPLFVTGKRAMIFGKQPYKLSWMAASDYAAMVSKAFSDDRAENRVFHIRGIERHTLEEALRMFGDVTHPGLKIVHAPIWMVSVVGGITRSKSARGLAQFFRFFDKNPETDANGEAEKVLGPALTTLRDWAEEYKRQWRGGS